MPYDEISPLWKLHDHLTVNQAAALLAGFDPGEADFSQRDYHEIDIDESYKRMYMLVSAALSSLTNAILNRSLKATFRYEAQLYTIAEHIEGDHIDLWKWSHKDWTEKSVIVKDEMGGAMNVRNLPCWELSTIARDDLIDWLKNRGLQECYFYSESKNPNPQIPYEPRYLDPNDSRYPFKLAAAVRAWEAMDDNKLIAGRGVVTALTKWLTANAQQLGLLHEKDVSNRYTKGSLNNTAIDEIAKVANWSGGGPQKLSND